VIPAFLCSNRLDRDPNVGGPESDLGDQRDADRDGSDNRLRRSVRGAMKLSWHLTGVGPVDTADVLRFHN